MAKQGNKEVGQSALSLLTSAAMALPGVSQAVTPPEKPEFGFRWEKYLEDETLGIDHLNNAPVERYDIDAFYFDLVLPLTENVGFVGKMDYETMSGATPWYTTYANDDNTRPVVFTTTGASVDDKRVDISGTGTYYVSSDTAVSGSVGFSKEEDYFALYGGMGIVLEFYNKHVTADFGVSFSSDKLTPTPAYAGNPAGTERIDEASKGTFSVYAGFTQVLNRTSTFQTGLSYTAKHGYLTDPYKLVTVFPEGTVFNDQLDITTQRRENENRPIDKKQLAWVARYRLYLEPLSTAFHLDYRYYSDNWEVYSNTAEASLHWRWKRLLLVGGYRYYTQTEASFYGIAFVGSCLNEVCSSDYRLSEFEANSLRFRAELDLGAITPVVSFETYDAEGDSPAIIDFNVLAVGFDWKF
jgi:hypothetical protein